MTSGGLIQALRRCDVLVLAFALCSIAACGRNSNHGVASGGSENPGGAGTNGLNAGQGGGGPRVGTGITIDTLGAARGSVPGTVHRPAPSSSSSGVDFIDRDQDWEAVTTFAACRTRLARRSKEMWPAFEWASCGAGCKTAPVALPGRTAWGDGLGTASRNFGGDLMVSLSIRVLGHQVLMGSFHFGDGVPHLLLSSQGEGCFSQVAGERAPLLFSIAQLGPPTLVQLGLLRFGQGPIIDWMPPFDLSKSFYDVGSIFDFETGWGNLPGREAVALTREARSSSLHEVYRSSSLVNRPVGDAGHVFWNEGWKGNGKLQALGPDDQVVTLASGDWLPMGVGVSSDRIVWIGAFGDRVDDGGIESSNLYSCRRTEPLEPCKEIETLTALPVISASGIVVVRDDWVALSGCEAEGCGVYLFHIPTSKLYLLRRLDGIERDRILGLSSTELVIAGSTTDERSDTAFSSLQRYDVHLLPEYAAER
jgi:hypothetical protein